MPTIAYGHPRSKLLTPLGEDRCVPLELCVIGGAADERTSDVGLDNEFANPLARDAHRNVHEHTMEVLYLLRAVCSVAGFALNHPPVLSEHAEIETVSNPTNSNPWCLARGRRQLPAPHASKEENTMGVETQAIKYDSQGA